VDDEHLYERPRWLKLLHYKARFFGAGYTSIVDDEQFFLATAGKHSPRDELRATLAVFHSDDVLVREKACRFPARAKFLLEHSLIDARYEKNLSCPEYADWRDKRQVFEAWLVFPSSYLNSPSSMFGHTLLRLDGRDALAKSKLLAYAVNYAAQVDNQDNGLFYAYRGIFGGYPGYFSMMPYYEKVKTYNRIENRDIWEYQLNLSEDEIEWLLRHLWELNEIRFDYFFTTQNCSYQLLSLLDVVRPDKNLTRRFEKVAIPVDTVREVIEQEWVGRSVYRPSKSTEFYSAVSALAPEEKAIVASIKDTELLELKSRLDSLDTARKVAVLEAAYKLLRIDKDSKKYKARALAVLHERSKLGKRDNKAQAIVPSPPEQGHLSHRLSLGAMAVDMADNTEVGASLEFRLAYHGLEDPIEGFSRNSQINFIDARLYARAGDVEIDTLDIVNIRSLSTSDRFISRRAWQVSVGWASKLIDTQNTGLVKQLNAEFGRVYSWGGMNVYALAGGQLEQHRDYRHDVEVGPRVDVGMFRQGERLSMELGLSKTYFIDSEMERSSLQWTSSLFLTKQYALGMSVRIDELDDSQRLTRSQLKLNYYF